MLGSQCGQLFILKRIKKSGVFFEEMVIFITLISEFGENNFFNVNSGKDGAVYHACLQQLGGWGFPQCLRPKQIFGFEAIQ